jgi:hypothetical protein
LLSTSRRVAVITTLFALSVSATAAADVPFTALAPVPDSGIPTGIVAADFDGDGHVDLATGNQNNDVVVLLGDGAGGFAPVGAPLAVGSTPVTLAVGDFNEDAVPDLAAPRQSVSDVAVLLGAGAGGFLAAPGSPFATGANPSTIVAADFNGDGHADLATNNHGTPNTLSVLLGDGDGGFAEALGSPVTTGTNTRGIAVTDANGDGSLDLVTAGTDLGGSVTVFLGNGNGGFAALPPLLAGTVPFDIQAGDLNGDGEPDLAFVDPSTNMVVVLIGDGLGGYTARPPIPVGTTPWSIAIADLDGDGRLDLTVVNHSSDSLTTLLGDGAGGFTAQPAIAVGTTPSYAAVADFDGDSRPDIAVTDSSDDLVSVLHNAGLPHAALDPPAQDFGTVAGGERTFTVSASGNAALRVGAVTLTGSDFSVVHDGCSHVVVDVGSTCSVRVAFTSSAAGLHSATLSVPSDAATVTTALSGTHVVPPAPPAPPTTVVAPPTTSSPPAALACASRRTVRIKLAKALRGARVTIAVDGHRIATLRHAGRVATVHLTGRPKATLRVTLRGARAHQTRIYHTCVPRSSPGRGVA